MQTYVICKRAAKQHQGVCPFTSIIKDQTAKARLLGIKCVSCWTETFMVYQRISRLHVMKTIYNFPEKSELPDFILPVKIGWIIFSAVFMLEMKNLQEKRQLYNNISCLYHLRFAF